MYPALALILAAIAAAYVASTAGAADLVNCDQWSAWEEASFGGEVRRRESCSSGRLDEQCRPKGGGPVTVCTGADADTSPSAGAARLYNIKRPAGKNFLYIGNRRSYYYYYYYYYSYGSWYVYCSTACIAGAAVGGLVGLGGLIGGIIVLYCFCFRTRRPGVVGPPATTTTTVVAAVPATTVTYSNQAYGNQAYGNQAYGNQAYGNQAYGNQAYGNQAYGNQAYGGNGGYVNGAYQNQYPPQQQNQPGVYPPPYSSASQQPQANPPAYPPAQETAGPAAYPPSYPQA